MREKNVSPSLLFIIMYANEELEMIQLEHLESRNAFSIFALRIRCAYPLVTFKVHGEKWSSLSENNAL